MKLAQKKSCSTGIGEKPGPADNSIYNVLLTRSRFGGESPVTVKPCRVGSRRVLIHERGLRENLPAAAYGKLERYARHNGFDLMEERRVRSVEVGVERRRKRPLPLLFLAGGLLLSSASAAVQPGEDGPSAVMEEITVRAVREKKAHDLYRRYKAVNGKRFVSEPYGETRAILAVAARVKQAGSMTRISTRRISMPHSYGGRILKRYDLRFPRACGGARFSYYEGEGFAALGLRRGERVILDVLAGGGAFSAPRLWGPYDQVLQGRHKARLRLMSGDGKGDGMGLLKASYSVGMMTDMDRGDMRNLGDYYAGTVAATDTCMAGMPDRPQPEPDAIRAVVADNNKP